MGLDMINSKIKLITIKHLTLLRYLEFQIKLEKIKYKNALNKLEKERELLIKSDFYTRRNYYFIPIKSASI